MINGFTTQTVELNTEEKGLVEKYFIPILSKKIGKHNAVTSKQMISGMKKKGIADLTGARIRKMIQYIRTNCLIQGLVATSSGYYVAQTQQELEEWIESIKQRELAMKESRIMAENTLHDWKKNQQMTMFKWT